MSKPKSARRRERTAEPHLKLVPPPKPKRRKRPAWFKKIGRTIKTPYEALPELHEYEDAIVLAVVEDFGTPNVKELLERYPERFNRKYLWLTLVRLYKDDKLDSQRGLGARGRSGSYSWWRFPCNPYRRFWVKPPVEKQ